LERKMKSALLATTAAGMMLLGTGAAFATPTFQITPNALPGISGYAPTYQSDINGTSAAVVTQTGANTQSEVGWVQGGSFTNNGVTSNNFITGMNVEPAPSTFYNLYLTFTSTVTGLTTFSTTAVGTVTSFSFQLKVDVGDNDTFAPGNVDGATTVNPLVTDTGSNDIVLAVGTSSAGSAAFQTTTGGPTFNTISNFILCDGIAGQGTLGGLTVAAAGCGTFNASTYFTQPVPFYALDFNSTTAGSINDVHVGPSGATINGIVADINFIGVPEPVSISLFGAGLAGVTALGRRRKAKKA